MYFCCWKKNKHLVSEKITFQNGPFYLVNFFLILSQKHCILTPTYSLVCVLGAPGISFSQNCHLNTISMLLNHHPMLLYIIH